MKHFASFAFMAFGLWVLQGCQSNTQKAKTPETAIETVEPVAENKVVQVAATDFKKASHEPSIDQGVSLEEGQWLSYQVEIPITGRYQVRVKAKSEEGGLVWIEDYINNKDDRTYDITGKIYVGNNAEVASIDGSPLQAGVHEIKMHNAKGSLRFDAIEFELMYPHKETPEVFEQGMEGEEWKLVWSDEFDGTGLPDSTKWSYNVGNWGWGNNELQYYTEGKTENARVEDGHLIIEAHKKADGKSWTSARLTTQGKASFLYGRVEFRAKVPVGRGTWAAGWMLGDDYRDEVSWPYCGEIDVLECVGYEIDDATGKGVNHATCHTRAYYFKQGNQIGSQIEVENMDSEFHTYAVEWYPNEIRGTLDGEHYFTYDKNADLLEWPFDQPQNIIVNLAIGGGWGGLKGVDEAFDSHQYILDYIRVYERQ